MLSIGSVVYLQAGNQKLMVMGLGQVVQQNGKSVYFDYIGCKFPEGINPNEVFYFNQEDIDKVIYEGYQDENSERLANLYSDWVQEENYPKGNPEIKID